MDSAYRGQFKAKQRNQWAITKYMKHMYSIGSVYNEIIRQQQNRVQCEQPNGTGMKIMCNTNVFEAKMSAEKSYRILWIWNH